MSNQSATAEKDKEKMKQKKEKKGLLSSAKAKATGSLRKALQKSKQMVRKSYVYLKKFCYLKWNSVDMIKF